MYIVKFLHKGYQKQGAPNFLRQLPQETFQFKNCKFVGDPHLKQYDWLVVYDDLPKLSSERHSVMSENLACPSEKTIFIMAEPSSIKTYGYRFLDQFGTIISCHEPAASPSSKTIRTIPGLVWFYGQENNISYDDIIRGPLPAKRHDISMVYSNKAMTHTLHAKRNQFMLDLETKLPELDIFGKGYKPLADKQDCLDPYKYHIAMENTIYPNYITEKLTDAYLGLSLPFYIGAPNVGDYFPEESFIRLNPDDVEGCVKTIRHAISNNEYERRLPFLIEARRRVLENHNMFAITANIIERYENQNINQNVSSVGKRLYSRRSLLRNNPLAAIDFGLEKGRAYLKSRLNRLSFNSDNSN